GRPAGGASSGSPPAGGRPRSRGRSPGGTSPSPSAPPRGSSGIALHGSLPSRSPVVIRSYALRLRLPASDSGAGRTAAASGASPRPSSVGHGDGAAAPGRSGTVESVERPAC
ncbi:hypothetical protein THAOC_24022, partial [Thalassiosira oceanica]